MRAYRLDPTVVADIDNLASELEVRHSAIVNLLLQIALDEVAAGRRRPGDVPCAMRLSWRTADE